MTENTIYSLTEDFCIYFHSFCELIDAAKDNEVLAAGCEYYQANCEKIDVSEVISVDHVLEFFDERASDGFIEDFHYNNDFSSVPTLAKEELHELILNWANKYVSPSFNYFQILNTVKKELTEDDIRESQ